MIDSKQATGPNRRYLWQRGSNENTNGLLRQYFPKGMDLSSVHQNRLNAVARQLDRLKPQSFPDAQYTTRRVAGIGHSVNRMLLIPIAATTTTHHQNDRVRAGHFLMSSSERAHDCERNVRQARRL